MKRTIHLFFVLLLLSCTLPSQGAQRFDCVTFSEDDMSRTKRFWTQDALDHTVPKTITFDQLPGGTAALAQRRRFGLFSRRRVALATSTAAATDVNEMIFPYSASGRLAFLNASGVSDWCTATLVEADNLLITAAHCVRSRSGVHHTSVAFIRSYDKANTTGEFFAVRRAATDVRWVSAPVLSRDHDYAILEVERAASQHLALTVVSTATSWAALGYPGAGTALKRDDGTRGKTIGNTVEMLDNVMAYGASGGPWIEALVPGSAASGTNLVTGISAGKTSTTITVGPVFTQDLLDLVQHVVGGCPNEED